MTLLKLTKTGLILRWNLNTPPLLCLPTERSWVYHGLWEMKVQKIKPQILTRGPLRRLFKVYFCKSCLFFMAFTGSFVHAQNNPFLRPGSKNAKPPVVSRPAPPPPKPIPRNPNLEFRGYYKFDGDWKIALFDKAKNQGYWLSKGESIDGLDAQVESFNPDTDELRLSGGMTL